MAILSSTTLACQPKTETANAAPPAEATITTQPQTVQVMQQMFEAFNKHDLEAMAALYADDAVFTSPEMIEPKKGKAAVAEIYGPLFEMAPDVQDEVKHYIYNGKDEIAVEFLSKGTVENIGPNDPPHMKGKEFELKIFCRLKVKDGKIIEDVTYYDQLAFLQQLGLSE
ncbi:nuclear transport factor 2 family protein [Pontibacter sp. H249]|uniref:nuclear transport factor 2 family protein n=1 Tax=Pontibacter sp. H249 TaxID=3133420 RepID=UPI0030C4F1BA